AFLMNHARDLIALDFFTVPTATFRVLFVLIVLSHGRRRLVHFNVTEHPTAEWTARQLIEACGQDESPRHLIRDRDQVYGERFSRQARLLDIREAVIAPRSPWQNAYAERVIGWTCPAFVATWVKLPMLRDPTVARRPGGGRRRANAKPRASRVRSSVRRSLIAQPTAKREQRSRITAR